MGSDHTSKCGFKCRLEYTVNPFVYETQQVEMQSCVYPWRGTAVFLIQLIAVTLYCREWQGGWGSHRQKGIILLRAAAILAG